MSQPSQDDGVDFDLSTISSLPVTMGLLSGDVENFTVADIDTYYLYAVEVAIVYAAQLGASLMLLIVVALITKGDRRRTHMFALNVLALALNFIRTLIGCIYFTGMFSEAYVYFSGDYDLAPRSEYNTQVAGSVVMLLLLAIVLAALMLQVQVVLITMPKRYRWLLAGSSMVISGLAFGFRVWYSIINIRAILNNVSDRSFQAASYYKTVVTALAILWFSTMFTVKLGHTVWRRRKMGVKKLGPMEILLIMGGQTMVIPAIFSLMEFLPTSLPVMDSLTVSLVVIFLPLSSLWATAVVDNRKSPSGVAELPAMNNNDSSIKDSNLTITDTSSVEQPLLSKLCLMASKLRVKTSQSSRKDISVASTEDGIPLSQLKRVDVDLEKQGF